MINLQKWLADLLTRDKEGIQKTFKDRKTTIISSFRIGARGTRCERVLNEEV